MVEKLAKALEGLRNIQFTTSNEDTNISKREKMLFCVLAADLMVSLEAKSTQNLPVIVESIINLCDDKDSDVRMVADESLNRIIMSLSGSNMLKVQVELHNILNKNGAARCVRAALTRFGQLSHYIRPDKGRGHVQKLIPGLLQIIKREEESIHETLASSLENIFKVLGVFLQDNDLKNLIKAFLQNLSSSNPVIRRSSASCIITLVQYCRKPLIFNCFVLNSLLDTVVPVCEDNSTDLILGMFGCLRLLLPTLISIKNDEGISGSFGLRRRQDESILSVDRLIQAYELCLYYTKSKDHNVVAAALETLNQILQNPPHQLETFFLSPAGFSRSYIHSARETKLWSRAGSVMSVAGSLAPTDEPLLLDDNDVSSQFSTFSVVEPFELKQLAERMGQSEDDGKTVESPFKEKILEKIAGQTTLDVDSDTESVATSDAPINFLMRVDGEDKEAEDSEFDGSRRNSQDNMYSPSEGDSSSGVTNLIDVGSFTDTAVPLVYCARHLAASFLLEGSPKCLKSDKSARVSIKSLALSCMSAIIKLYPVTMKMNLGKNRDESSWQEMSDILLYCEHSDPQIRGGVSVLVGHFIDSALFESRGFKSDWLSAEESSLSCDRLVDVLLKGLKDKSSVCVRQALIGFKHCIQRALFSVYNNQFLPLLHYLPALTNNSYWLVKVKLADVLSDLPYSCIYDLTKSSVYQEDVIDSVLLPLHGDEDSRVRLAAAEALVRVIPVLYRGKATVPDYAKPFADHLRKWLKVNKDFACNLSPCPPFSYMFMDPEEIGFDEQVELSLSKVVAKLTHALLVPENKYFLFGYLEALKLLSQKYPTTVYSKAWNCWKPEERDLLTSNLVGAVLSLLLTSPFPLDLAAFSNATHLLGNLFAGLSVFYLKTNYEFSVNPLAEDSSKLWDVFKNERISRLAEEVLTHLLKVLNFYTRLVEEVTLSSVSESSAVNAFLPLLSPVKKQEKKSGEKAEEKKSKSSNNNYKQSTQYGKLQQLLKNAHTNYRVSLDASVRDKFLDLLESTLHSLSALLEVATVRETGRCAHEILAYLRAIVSLRPTPAVICVIQLLRSLFGTNLASHWGEGKPSSVHFHGSNHIFDMLFHLPTEFLSEKIRRRINSNFLECETLAGPDRRGERKVVIKNSDKNCLATYIRVFEPIVVKSLQLYMITGNVELQSSVLKLLNQMVLLRVNYCLLDEKQVFLDFVLKQFELIEHGQIPGVEILLPHIFKFLVLLSYAKQHSKPIMSIPKTLQLCDGLMASDQPVQTHCIPALFPVVEDVFLSRSLVFSAEELSTQREVLLSMLLRLAEFPKVMDMLTVILNESKTIEEKEKWKQWSRQVIDTLLPLVSQDRLRIETLEGQTSFAKLISSVSPNALRPIDPLLKALFVEPSDHNCPTSLKRWLAKVTVLLETVLFVKEDSLLSRLGETCPSINLATFLPSGNLGFSDPFNVKSFFQIYEPAETAARFILKVICSAGNKVAESIHLQQKLSMFFVCVFHILKSGAFHRITNALQDLLSKEQDSLTRICLLFQKMTHVCPMLTCQFSYFLALLNYCDENYWSQVLRKPSTLSGKLVQSSGVIALSDYLCDNLSDTTTLHFLLRNSARELISHSHEIPIKELLVTIRRRKSDWALFLETISSGNFQFARPHFVERLLRLLEITESSHSAALLALIVNKFLAFPHLALALLAGSIACRQVECLLTLPKEKVLEQIDRDAFEGLISFFKDEKYLKRHFTLWSLLEKLGIQVFDLSLSHLNSSHGTEVEVSKDVRLEEDWYFGQIKSRCCQKGFISEDISILLSKLSYERIVQIMSCSEFSLRVLKDCLLYPETLRHKHQLQEYDNKERDFNPLRDPLFKASRCCLMRKLKEMRGMLKEATGEDRRGLFEKLLSIRESLGEMASCLTLYLRLIYANGVDVEQEQLEDVSQFGLLCLQMIDWDVQKEKEREEKGEIHPRNMENGLRCCGAVLKSREVASFLSQPPRRQQLRDCVGNVFHIVRHLIPSCRLNRVLADEDLICESESDRLEFLLKFVTEKSSDSLLPEYLMDCFRDVVVSLCRIPVLSLHVLKVPESGEMQDIELLKGFISRFSAIGWSSRQQFEEIWVALLSVLGFNTQGDVPLEETGFIVQASTVAVDGITTLLKNTLLDPVGKGFIHHGRDSLSMKNFFEKLPLVPGSVHEKDRFSDRAYHFLDNLELSLRDDRYVHGLLSVEYLWTAVKQISSQVDLYEKHSRDLKTMGLDLPSCIHLLTELYNQWIHQASPDIRIVTSSLKSSIVISDLFTDIAQFQWLLNFCLRTDEVVIPEDTVILPLIILGCCKASAIVLPNEEVCEKIRKLLMRSKNLPCRIAVIRGLLYLLQSYIVCYAVNHTALPPPGSTFQTEEANFVANVVDTFLPVALEIIQEFKLASASNEPIMEEYERCHWSLIFYLLQHYQSSLGDLKEEFLDFVVATLYRKNCRGSTMSLLIRGTERVLLTTIVDEHFKEELTKVSLEIISNNSIVVSRNGLQLLTVLSFLDKRVKDVRQLVMGQDDPEKVMKDMEKINVLFEALKKSYPKEADVVGNVTSYVLKDFTASDVLTKVIQEFLSTHQPHQKILAGLLFKAFERAEHSLLEDWVVFTLPSFIQGLPIAMSIWTLNCFFVSASSEPWLRSLFPLAQSRIRMAEPEDKKLLCLSASHFYNQLKQDSQRKSFVQTFQKAAGIDPVFLDLLSSLT